MGNTTWIVPGYLFNVCLHIWIGGLCCGGGAVVIVNQIVFEIISWSLYAWFFLSLFLLLLGFCFTSQLPFGFQPCSWDEQRSQAPFAANRPSLFIWQTLLPLVCTIWELSSWRFSLVGGSGRSRSLSMAPIRLAYSASSAPMPLVGNEEPAKLWPWTSSCLVFRAFRLVSWQAGEPSWPEFVLPLVSCEEVTCIDGRL